MSYIDFLTLLASDEVARRDQRQFAQRLRKAQVVGVFSGMVILGEAPRWQDYAALALVLTAIATVLLPPRAAV